MIFVHFAVQLKKYFTFEVQVLDDKKGRRRFRASNYQFRHIAAPKRAHVFDAFSYGGEATD